MFHFHLLAQVAAQVATKAAPAPWEWVASHLQLVGWPTICVIAWKVGRTFNNVTSSFHKAVSQIDTMATNHFPHMEASLAKQDNYLENIDRNIERLADKL